MIYHKTKSTAAIELLQESLYTELGRPLGLFGPNALPGWDPISLVDKMEGGAGATDTIGVAVKAFNFLFSKWHSLANDVT